MYFLKITSLGTAYHYAAKIKEEFKHKKRVIGSPNPNPWKGTPNVILLICDSKLEYSILFIFATYSCK